MQPNLDINPEIFQGNKLNTKILLIIVVFLDRAKVHVTVISQIYFNGVKFLLKPL